MKAIAPVATPVLVELTDGQPTTTSLDVAAHFGKRHERVLDKIRNLDCSPEFTEHNFVLSEYTDLTGRSLPQYRMTRDGFTFLCMGFTGKEAAKWKEAYINAFNQMEHTLKHGAPAKSKRPPKLLPNGLSADQQEAIKGLVKARVEALPQSKQAKAAITCWSALKSKFGCSYKEIDAAQFAEALSLVARLPLEGELLEAERPKPLELHYPASWLPEHNPHLRGYSYERSADPSLHLNTSSLCGMDSRSPTLALTAELTRAGHDVEACRMEVLAMRHQLERYLDLCRNLGNLADRHEHGGIVFKLSGAVHMTR